MHSSGSESDDDSDLSSDLDSHGHGYIAADDSDEDSHGQGRGDGGESRVSVFDDIACGYNGMESNESFVNRRPDGNNNWGVLVILI